MSVRIQIKRDTTENLLNYVAKSGEPVFDTETGILKVGNGEDTFEDIPNISATSERSIYLVHNNTGSTVYKGQAVYSSGVKSGGKIILIDKFISDGSIDEIRFIGLARDNIIHGQDGQVVHFGHIAHVDTRNNSNINDTGTNFVEGDILYVSADSPGKLVTTKPKDAISVALVLYAGNNGELLVRPTNFGHLEDKHDVKIENVASGDGLIYNSTTEMWENVGVPKSDPSSVHPNASGVYNIVVVDSDTYNSITKDPNTIYFVS